jgi:hypothetical protein
MFTETGAHFLVPIHWGTFRLGREPVDEPMRRLVAAAGPASDRIVMRTIGEAWTMPREKRDYRASSAAGPGNEVHVGTIDSK